ncbi:chromate transporter [Sorangium cellulosum]|uniref:Chromate transporter n=1 Tax=Sorangium cellulosum TaxID=56 RepID=A0A4P2QC34_SORCE|nr:chromate efflux transporter [Sorangium cellulosum]AUX26921.1 chromate transporter [Sorangium cellulosum]
MRDEPTPASTSVRRWTAADLRELAWLFLRLGVTAFGGPAAHIAMMQDEVVRRRRWLSEERFLDLLGATNLIPGPNSTEMAIHIGYERARGPGLAVAGICFIVPAMLITGALGWAYVRFGTLPTATWLLYGIKPVMIAVVVRAIGALAPRAARTTPLRLLGATAAVLAWLGVNELAVLLGAGAASAALARLGGGPGAPSARPPAQDSRPPAPDGERAGGRAVALAPWLPGFAAAGAVTLPGLFWVFFKTGAVLFGSGYVLLAFLRADLVERLGWMTEAQLVDAIAVGQVTPGPVFTTATFVGYVLAGPAGALVATLGIFLPAFFFVAVSGPLVPRLRRSPVAGAVLDGVNVASLALMLVVTAQLGRASLIDLPTALLAAASALLLFRFKINTTWLIALGGALGWAIHRAGLAG